jgi:cytochrome c oxidase subunit II
MRLTKKLAVFVLAAAVIASGWSLHARADQAPPVVKITASKFHFMPDHIMLRKGQPVTLQITSTDTTHGFMIRKLSIDTDIKPGKITAVTVTPAVAGNFKAICDYYCGLGHGTMKLTISVVE